MSELFVLKDGAGGNLKNKKITHIRSYLFGNAGTLIVSTIMKRTDDNLQNLDMCRLVIIANDCGYLYAFRLTDCCRNVEMVYRPL